MTDDEKKDVFLVASLLGLSEEDAAKALDAAVADHDTRQPAGRLGSGFTLAKGDLVVFTGRTSVPREELEAQALGAGLRIHQSITREGTSPRGGGPGLALRKGT